MTGILEDNQDDIESIEQQDENADHSNEDSSIDADDENQMDVGEPVEDSNTGFLVFRCSDSQCIKWYLSIDRCEDHIISGKHVYSENRLSLLDTAVHAYQFQTQKISSHSGLTLSTDYATSQHTNTSRALVEGWALPQPKLSKRFSKEQIAFLVDKSDEGERSGHKWNPATVASVSGFSLLLKTNLLC